MFRLFALCILLLFNTYACEGGYASCVKKMQDAHVIEKSALFIPIANHKLLLYSSKKPDAKILKHDPFLSLYLIEDRAKFSYPFDTNMRLQLGSAIVNASEAKEGKILKHQVGLNALAEYSAKIRAPALITSSCCSLEGMVTSRGVIEKEYIRRFLSSTPVSYADIGVRVKNEKGVVVVRAIDPYKKDNPFQKGDCIVEFDGVKVSSASLLMRKILFSKIGSKHSVSVKRDAELKKFQVKSTKRYGGGVISDTFLEKKGIFFDASLHIVSLSGYYKKYGLKVGDKLMRVNGVSVKNQRELQKYIEDFKEFSQLLFTRNEFEFFVKIVK